MTDSSMPDSSVPPQPDAPVTPGLLARAIGVITAPGETFKHIVRTPKVSGALFIVCLATALSAGLPQFTERGRAAALEAQVEAMERMGMTVTDEMYGQLAVRSQSNLAGYITLVSTFVMVPVASVFFTALFWFIFNTILGGTATFKHVMAVVVHSQIVQTLGAVIAAPIMFARGQMSTTGVANLGGLVPFLEESSFLARFLGMIDLFLVWWVIVLAIGLAALYKRTATGVATGLLITYGAIALVFAFVFSR